MGCMTWKTSASCQKSHEVCWPKSHALLLAAGFPYWEALESFTKEKKDVNDGEVEEVEIKEKKVFDMEQTSSFCISAFE